MHFHIVTLFPEFFASPLAATMLAKGVERGALAFSVHDIRVHTTDRHRTADDTPYGGGRGMVMKPEPLVAAIEAADAGGARSRRVLLSPRGRVLDGELAHQLAREAALTLVCGRYEGVDERVREFVDDEVSVGDYVLSGGEPAALIVVDAVARLVPGVLGCAESAVDESFAAGLLEYPQYTRPPRFRGLDVPAVLLSGDHGEIAAWRRREALRRTLEWRPELLRNAELSAAERAWVAESLSGSPAERRAGRRAGDREEAE
jgi:tRNA (guanine37-N1)-methyltransferase